MTTRAARTGSARDMWRVLHRSPTKLSALAALAEQPLRCHCWTRGSQAQRLSRVHAGTPWTSEADVRARTPSPPRSSRAVERTSQPPHISRQQCTMAHSVWRPIAHMAVLCAARAGVADTSGPTSSVMAATCKGKLTCSIDVVVLSSSCHCRTLACRPRMQAAMLRARTAA